MILLYHGGTDKVARPVCKFGRPYLDFGPGFYLTDIRQQAVDWAKRQAVDRRLNPMLNVYSFNPNRSLGFGQIARLCHAACFSPSRRRSGLRRGRRARCPKASLSQSKTDSACLMTDLGLNKRKQSFDIGIFDSRHTMRRGWILLWIAVKGGMCGLITILLKEEWLTTGLSIQWSCTLWASWENPRPWDVCRSINLITGFVFLARK